MFDTVKTKIFEREESHDDGQSKYRTKRDVAGACGRAQANKTAASGGKILGAARITYHYFFFILLFVT
jgi:hypothetical protein